ncbi:cytoplasmic protein, partial [Bacillus sp. 103mf]
RQNDAFPNDFQSKVASTDVIEQEIEEQMRGIDQTKAGIEVISNTLPGMQAMMGIFDMMKQKLQEKLNHLREFNSTSSSNYDTALQLAASIAQGLAEVQSGKGFSPASGTFSTQGLNMEWTGPIQKIAEEKAREAESLKDDSLFEEEVIEKSKLENFGDSFRDGARQGFGDAWEGFLSLGEGETWANIGNSLIHPIDTLSTMYNVISDSFMRDVWNGDLESRARWSGYALAQIGTGLLGTKGLDKITTLAKGANFTKVTDIAGTMTPRLQPAWAGGFAGTAIETGAASTVASSSHWGHYLGGLGNYLLFARPSWKASENEVGKIFEGYTDQVAFKDRQEVSRYTKGSTRPDFYIEGHSIEVKNYDVSTKSRRTNLVNTIVKQVNDRVAHLPEGTKQTIIIDIRGQTVSNDILREIRAEISKKANTLPEIEFIKED